ncbi:MAG: 50S ribosomal protein L28 [bacterium]
MANACDLCSKKRDVGHTVSHSKRRTQRIRKPNLHTHRLATVEGKIKMTLCTKCLRMVKGVNVAPVATAAKLA